MPDLCALQTRLGYQFRDPELLRLALTHPSMAHEKGFIIPQNQRLEFLGDAVLQLVLTRELYDRFPAFGEGPLTTARAHLVNRQTLAEQGRHLGLGQYLLVSRGEETSGGRDRASTLADAFEALLGAIFVDASFEVARDFILRLFGPEFSDADAIPHLDNPKGDLQEVLQAHSAESPQYLVQAVEGPDHDRLYECAVYHSGAELGRGRGKSKKAAEGQAALLALENLRRSSP